MNTVKMLVDVDQQQAILAGRSEYGKQIVAVPVDQLNEAQRRTLTELSYEYGPDTKRGLSPYIVGGGGLTEQLTMPPVPDTGLASIQALLDAWPNQAAQVREKWAAKQAEEESRILAAISRWELQSLDSYLSEPRWNGRGWSVNDPDYNSHDQNYVPSDRYTDTMRARMTEAQAEAARRNEQRRIEREEREKREEEEREKKEREAQALAEARTAQIAEWIAEKGTDNQKGRAALNLLPEDEILDAMRDEAFAALDGFDRYEEIKKGDLGHEEYCASGVSCDVFDAGELTADQFDRFDAIRKAIPSAAVSALVHSCKCQGCDATLDRDSVRVTLTVGSITFSREYSL